MTDVLRILGEETVVTDISPVVVLSNVLLQNISVHAGHLGELVKRIRLLGPASLFSGIPLGIELRKLRRDRNHHADAEVDTFVLHVVKRRLIVHNPHLAAVAFQSVAGKRPLEHDGFINKAVAFRVQPEVRLLGGSGNLIRGAHALRTRTVGSLNLNAVFSSTGLPGHLDAVAGLAGLSETVNTRESEILLLHRFVGTETAGGDNHSLRVDGDLVAILVLRDHTSHNTVRTLDQIGGGGIQEQRAAVLHKLVLILGEPASATAFINVPGVETIRIVREELLKLHAVALHPVNRARGLFHERADHAAVTAPVAVTHDALEGVILRQAVVPVTLHLGLNRHDAFGEFAGTARNALLLKQDHLGTEFLSCHTGRGTAAAGAEHHDIGAHRLIRGLSRENTGGRQSRGDDRLQ